MTKAAQISERILVLTPTGNDAANAVDVLRQAGLTGTDCRGVEDLAEKLLEGAGALLLAEEALTPGNATCLVEVLSSQPRWSDIPLLLATSANVTAQAGQKLLNFFAPHGNVTLIERPLRPISLVSAVQTALRARRRQYQLRGFLEEQEQTSARLQIALEAGQLGHWDLDLRTHTATRSLRHDQIFGYSSLLPEWSFQTFLEHVLPDDRAIVADAFQRSIAACGSWDLECRIVRADGSPAWIWARGNCLADADGTPARVLGVVADITERKKVFQALQENERRFRAVFNQQFQFMALLSPEGAVLEVNDVSLRATGIPREQVIGKSFWEAPFWTNLPETRRAWQERLSQAAGAHEPVLFAGSFQTAAGEVRIADNAVTAVKNAEGAVEFLIVQASDITERKNAEDALRESETRFRSLADESPMMIWMADKSANITYANRAFLDFLGLENVSAFSGRAWEGMVHPDDVARVHEVYGRAVREQQPFTFEVRYCEAAGGEFHWHLVKGVPRFVAGEFAGYIGTGVDIHARKQAEEALRASEERYRTLFNSIDEGFCMLEMLFDGQDNPVDYRFLEISPSFEKQTGLVNARGKRAREVTPELEPHWFDIYGRVALTGEPVRFQNYAAPLQRWFDVYAFRIGRPEERKVALLFNDDTARKKIETERERETRRVKLLADAAGQLLSSNSPEQIVREIFSRVAPELSLDVYFNFMVGETGRMLLLNSCAGVPEGMIHHVSQFPFGNPVCGVVAQERRAWTVSHLQQFDEPELPFLRQLGLRSYTCNPLIVGDRLLGTLSFGSRTCHEFDQEDIDYLRTICHFVALAQERALHQRDLENRVEERTAKLQETIGELEAFSYSVSHDLRAPLRAMQGYSQFLIEDYAGKIDPIGKDYINRIVKAAERLDRLVSDILTYSRVTRAHIKTSSIDLEKLIQEVIHSYPALQPDKADIQIQSPLLPVIGHEGSLTQCISNLLGNAVKFVPDGEKPRVQIWTELRDGRARIHFQDNGIGISREDQARIFQMFEKAPHERDYEGTGIGLAIVRKAVERMGGDAGVESNPGEGSRFWIELPHAP